MSLIRCPECGHDVSTLAAACPNCGCPTSAMQVVSEQSENTICEIYGVPVDLSGALSVLQTEGEAKAILYIRETLGLEIPKGRFLVNEIIANGMKIPRKSNLPFDSVPAWDNQADHAQLDAILGGIATGLFLSL